MFCPRCGHDGTSDQKFCRSCGFELAGVAELLQEVDLTEHDTQSHSELGAFNPNKLRLVGSIAVAATISLALIAMLIGIVVLMVNGNMPVLAGAAILIFLIGLFVGLGCLQLSTLNKQLLPAFSFRAKAVKDKVTSELPGPADGQALPSVTEGTTDLLKDPMHRVERLR